MARASEPPTTEETESTTVTNQEGEQYKTQGKTRLATRHGHRFRPSDKSLPEITPVGVDVTKEQAEQVLAESKRTRGTVYLVETEKEG